MNDDESLATGASASSASHQNLKQTGLHASSGSYVSLKSMDKGSRHRPVEDNHGNSSSKSKSNQEPEDKHDDDNTTQRSGERSPLRRSFDSDELALPVSSFHGDPLAGTSGRSGAGDSPEYPSISDNLYAGAFDFDDDDDDEELEAELRRYHLDFSTTERGTTLTHSYHGASSANENSPTAASRFSIAKYLWHSFQSVRQQARQRRAQLLLQQTERNWQQSLWICLMTNCDATDRGIMLVASLIVVWTLLVWRIDDPVIRRWIIFGGIAAFVVRVGTRPLCGYCRRQQQKRRLRSMQQLPQHSPISKHEQGARRSGAAVSLSLPSDLGGEIGKPHYADRPQGNQQSYGNNNSNINGTLELPSVRPSKGVVWIKGTPNRVQSASDDAMLDIQPSRSTGSDPTVAAI
jgi:hypothetical protein